MNCGEVLASISSAGFKIGAVFAVHMTSEIAEEIFDVYSGVYSSHSKMMQQLCSGCSLAVMIVGSDGLDVVSEFREFVGPFQPEIARTLRPKTLRARFGVDDTHNAIHCTDLSEDGEMECRYFFEIISGL
jgi:nucleoside-diphosphate kinase